MLADATQLRHRCWEGSGGGPHLHAPGCLHRVAPSVPAPRRLHTRPACLPAAPPVPQGWDKTYCLQFVKAEFDEIHFFGDKTFQVGAGLHGLGAGLHGLGGGLGLGAGQVLEAG